MTDRTSHQEDDSILAAEFALGILPQSERQAIEKRLAEDPRFVAEVRQWDEHFAGFATAISPAEPAPQLWRNIERRLFAASTSVSDQSLWNSLKFWRGFAVAAVAGVIILGAWNLRTGPGSPPTTSFIAQVAGDAAKLKFAILYEADSGELRLTRVAGSTTTGRSQELWLIESNQAPISLGVLPDSQSFRIKLPEQLRGKLVGSVLAVSDEPLGGSPTGAPTGAVLATGELTKV